MTSKHKQLLCVTSKVEIRNPRGWSSYVSVTVSEHPKWKKFLRLQWIPFGKEIPHVDLEICEVHADALLEALIELKKAREVRGS